MSILYGQVPENHEAARLRDHAIEEWHYGLLHAEARVGLLWAGNETEDRAIRVKGHYLAARVRVVPALWRSLGCPDAVIEICKFTWDELEPRSQLALIDHELCHLMVVTDGRAIDETGKFRSDDRGRDVMKVVRDDLGRPKLKTQPGDWGASDGFMSVVRRHGRDAVEAIGIRSIAKSVDRVIDEKLQAEGRKLAEEMA